LAFILLYVAVWELVQLPASIYFGHILEHRHGLSQQSFLGFTGRLFKATLAGTLAFGALAFGLYALARRKPRTWWLWLGLPCALALTVATSFDPARSRLYFDSSPLPPGPLRARIDTLLRETRTDVSDIRVEITSVATRKVQASFEGDGPTRSVVLSDTLVQAFSEEEILAAVAHEAAHVHEPRMLKTWASALALLVLLFFFHQILCQAARRGWWGTHDFADIRTLPLLSLLFFICTMVAGPFAAHLSRERELAADAWAVQSLGTAAPFERMLLKAARLNKLDPEPPAWVVWRGASHPPLSRRLEALQRLSLEKNRQKTPSP
jgi:STE24 endopeptidase